MIFNVVQKLRTKRCERDLESSFWKGNGRKGKVKKGGGNKKRKKKEDKKKRKRNYLEYFLLLEPK